MQRTVGSFGGGCALQERCPVPTLQDHTSSNFTGTLLGYLYTLLVYLCFDVRWFKY